MKNIELLGSLSVKQIKDIFFYIDGTLVNRNHKIFLSTRRAIAELIKHQITVSREQATEKYPHNCGNCYNT